MTLSMQAVAEVKNEVSEATTSLAQQRRDIEKLVGPGPPPADPAKREAAAAVAATLKEHELSEKAFGRLDEMVTRVGKDAFAVQDIQRAQSEFLRAVR